MRIMLFEKKAGITIGVFCSVLASAGVCSTAMAWNLDSEKEDYRTMEEWNYYADTVEEVGREYDYQGGFALCDMNGDGMAELLISTGTCNADWYNYVYTIEDDTVTYVDGFYGADRFYKAPEGKGLYAVNGKMGYQRVEWINMEKSGLWSYTVLEGELEIGQDYYENEDEIELLYYSEIEFE